MTAAGDSGRRLSVSSATGNGGRRLSVSGDNKRLGGSTAKLGGSTAKLGGSTASLKRNASTNSIDDPHANANVSFDPGNDSSNNGAMNASALQELHEIFSLVDRDGGGTISAEELRELMKTLGLKTTQAELAVMVQEIDTKGDGVIDFEEFVAAMARKVTPSVSKEKLKWAFRAFEVKFIRDDLRERHVKLAPDANPFKLKGTIPMRYLMAALTIYGDKKMSREDAEDMIAQIAPGLNPDDDFDYNRYIDIMFTNSY